MVAAAVVGGAIIGGVGSAMAGDASASAVKQGNREAIAASTSMSAPYRDLGSSAIPQYENLLGIGKEGPAGIQAALEATPGYQFSLAEGQKGILNQASLAGGVSGNTLADLNKFNVGLADTTYQQRIGDVAGAVNTGQAAAAGQAKTSSDIYTQQGQDLAGIKANEIGGISKSLGSVMSLAA